MRLNFGYLRVRQNMVFSKIFGATKNFASVFTINLAPKKHIADIKFYLKRLYSLKF